MKANPEFKNNLKENTGNTAYIKLGCESRTHGEEPPKMRGFDFG